MSLEKFVTLPDNLVDLIDVALKDMKAVKADPKYCFDVSRWHKPSPHSVCYVCVAGAVMAKSLNCHTNENLCPHDFELQDSRKLFLLDRIRQGHAYNAKLIMSQLGWDSGLLKEFFVKAPDSILRQLEYGKTTAWETLLCHLKNS